MSLGLIGKKIGMTRIFTEDGESVPVTVVEAQPNRVTQLRTLQRDGYTALQVTIGERRPRRVVAPQRGHFAAAGVEPGRGLWEMRVEPDELEGVNPGSELTVEMFESGQSVDVRGTTIGKGFAGVMKRHGFGGGRASHGNSKAHRKAGSIGQNQDPGRVFPGKKMAGRMGGVTRAQQNLKVVRVDPERNLLLIRGSIPGPRGFDVIVKPTVKGQSTKA